VCDKIASVCTSFECVLIELECMLKSFFCVCRSCQREVPFVCGKIASAVRTYVRLWSMCSGVDEYVKEFLVCVCRS